MKDFAYHQWTTADVEKHFDTDVEKGLSDIKADFRLKKYGRNVLTASRKNSTLTVLLHQFKNFFVGLLFCAAVISYFVDGTISATILLAIILVNVLLGFFQEHKAGKSLDELKQTFISKSKVIREGKIHTVDSAELVIGDVIVLEAGDKIPADGRIILEESMRIDESVLTGESLPISKNAVTLPLETFLADRRNMVYTSTVAVSGHCKAVIVATGDATEFGKIAQLIQKDEGATPLEKQIDYIGKMISTIGFAIALAIFILGYLRHDQVWELLTFTIALLVAIVPESLPTAITLSLATGVSRLARKNAIVRKLAVIETLGTTNVIVTDKTGTLTDNNLSIDRVSLYSNKKFEQIIISSNKNISDEVLSFMSAGLACSNVDIQAKNEDIGDPLELAIIEKMEWLDNLSYFNNQKYHRVLEIPFDSDKKYMAVLVSSNDMKSLIVKGMAEKIINFCDLTVKEKSAVLDEATRLSQDGFKVIALARKQLRENDSSALAELKFLGFFAFVDEPSVGIKDAIRKTVEAGIRPIILTGDHPETAKFIAEKIGITVADNEIINGAELELMDDRTLAKSLKTVKIFARVTPEDKIKIVQALQKMGYSVAMTGDGVNDAPALKEAQVGIAMGIKGTDIARDSADIVLLDDRYGTIVSAVEYGRAIYDNIRNTVIFLLSSNLAEMIMVGVTFIFFLPVPLLTLQILWINLVMDSLPSLAYSFEEPSQHILREPPRSAKSNSMKNAVFYSLSLCIVTAILCLILYLWGIRFSIDKARTMAFCYIVAMKLVLSLSIRSKRRIWESPKAFFENKYLLVAIGISLVLQLLLFVTPLSKVFHVKMLSGGEVVALAVFTIITFISAELIRYFHDKRDQKAVI
ncbi:MAG: cation-transporting P-type ATPase [Candidatus Berkelbacteria bacterium]